MKKIIGIIFISLMFANIGFAEMRFIEDGKISGGSTNYFMATICVDGYKFFGFRPGSSTTSRATSMVQFMEDFNNAAVPAKC